MSLRVSRPDHGARGPEAGRVTSPVMPGVVALVVALGLQLVAVAVTFTHLRRISAQLAVLTLRVADLVEIVDALETDLRA
jgi:hypothetical protein